MHDLQSIQTTSELRDWNCDVQVDEQDGDVTLELYSPERSRDGVARVILRYPLPTVALVDLALQLLEEIAGSDLDEHDKHKLRTSVEILLG